MQSVSKQFFAVLQAAAVTVAISRLIDRLPGVLGTRPGHLRRLRPGDAHSRASDGVALLCSTASAAQHSSPRLGDRLSVACYCFSSQPAGLR